jgi:hypothetical protein
MIWVGGTLLGRGERDACGTSRLVCCTESLPGWQPDVPSSPMSCLSRDGHGSRGEAEALLGRLICAQTVQVETDETDHHVLHPTETFVRTKVQRANNHVKACK